MVGLLWPGYLARGINNKEVVFKKFLAEQRAVYGGVSESHTYRNDTELKDSRWRWDAGAIWR